MVVIARHSTRFSRPRLITSLFAALVSVAAVQAQSNYATPYTFTTLAGAGPANVDGTGAAARFNFPQAITATGAGAWYVADTFNHTIRKVTADGIVTTFAGVPGVPGTSDGTGSAAHFNYPSALSVDSAGNLYVADAGNHTIRKVTSAGVVTTFAGTAGISGTNDGPALSARFNNPMGVVADGSGNVYVADTNNQTIRKINAGSVTTFAGSVGYSGYSLTDGTGTAALFHTPMGMAVDSSGNLYVADHDNNVVREITPAAVVTTLASAMPGSGGLAQFYHPSAVAVDAAGMVYVADTGNSAISTVTTIGRQSFLAGNSESFGSADGTGTAAYFDRPAGVAIDGSGNVYVADTWNQTIRKVTSTGVTTTLAGTAMIGQVDGTGRSAKFYEPSGVVLDGIGNLYVSDLDNRTIRKVTKTGAVTTFIGPGSTIPFQISAPCGLGLDASGNLYIADRGNGSIYKTGPVGPVSLIGIGGSPCGLGLDGSGNVYFSDQTKHVIRKITPAGDNTILAGSAGNSGSADGTGNAARFNYPIGLAVDAAGMVYVADSGNSIIRKITPAGVVTTIAGTALSTGSADGIGGAARFSSPNGIAVDAAGNLYVADNANNNIRKITPAGVVTTLAGNAAVPHGSTNGIGANALFFFPIAVAVDAAGNLYVADCLNQTIRKGTPPPPVAPAITAQPVDQSVTSGHPATFTVTATGMPPPTYQWQKNGMNIGGATGQSFTIVSTALTDAGAYRVVVTNPSGTVTSSAAVLTVVVTAPVMIVQPVNQTAVFNGTATFSANAAGSQPLTYQWMKHGVALANGGNISGATGAALTITGVQPADFTDYAVMVSNSFGTVTSDVAFLTFLNQHDVISATANGKFSLILLADGNLCSTGENLLGELGDGTTKGKSSPVQVATNVSSMCASLQTSMFIKSDGTLWGMGANGSGQFGNGTTGEYHTPVQIGTGLADVQSGGVFSLLLKFDGTLWATGDNSAGQLGDGTNTGRTSPVKITGNVSRISAGTGHSMFIKSDGTLWGMGNNNHGQLGDGTNTNRSSPVQIASGVVAAVAGTFNSMFIKTDGSLWAMGRNTIGELGAGTVYGAPNSPVLMATGVLSATTGDVHTLYIKTDGWLWGTGANDSGQLGAGSSIPYTYSPIPLTNGARTGPATPAGLTAVADAFPHQVRLAWNHTLGASGYEVWRSATNTPGSATQIAANVPTPLYYDLSGVEGTTYYYWIKATNPAGISEFSSGASPPQSVPTARSRDFNHDGRGDALWHSRANGLVASWTSGGGFTVFGTEGDGWSVIGTGDFDGDGHADALWRNTATGLVAAWTSGSGFTVLGVEDSNWSVLGAGDFDGDGRTDVLWHNATNGTVACWTSSGGYTVLGAEGGGWEVIGIGDFNGDGTDDLLWHNTYTGVVSAGLTNGSYVALDTEGGGWAIIGLGDFNGDGLADLLWHNTYTGVVSAELMNGGYLSLGTEDAGWAVIGTGDFDGDGIADVLWHNTSTGLVASWTSSGGFTVLGVEGDGWSVIR